MRCYRHYWRISRARHALLNAQTPTWRSPWCGCRPSGSRGSRGLASGLFLARRGRLLERPHRRAMASAGDQYSLCLGMHCLDNILVLGHLYAFELFRSTPDRPVSFPGKLWDFGIEMMTFLFKGYRDQGSWPDQAWRGCLPGTRLGWRPIQQTSWRRGREI